MRTKVLFLCTRNSCRSQMAEALMNHFHGGEIEAHSAGTNPASVHPLAISVLSELGIETSGLRSKGMREFLGQELDYAITLCGDAEKSCPAFPSRTRHVHIGFDDPDRATGTDDEKLAVFRRVRDEIRERLAEFFRREGVLETSPE